MLKVNQDSFSELHQPSLFNLLGFDLLEVSKQRKTQKKDSILVY